MEREEPCSVQPKEASVSTDIGFEHELISRTQTAADATFCLPARLTAWPPRLARTVENCVHVMHSHPFITSRCWVARQQRLAFWIPANMPCSHVIPNVPSARNAPAAHYSTKRNRETEAETEREGQRESETLPCCTLFCRTSKHLVGLENKWVCWSFFVCCTRLPFAGNIQFSTDFRHP